MARVAVTGAGAGHGADVGHRRGLARFVGDWVFRPGLAPPPYSYALIIGFVALVVGTGAVLAARSTWPRTELLIGLGDRRLAWPVVIAIFVTVGTAIWALGVAAIASGPRGRLWLAAVAVLSCGISATVFNGSVVNTRQLSILVAAYPSVDFGLSYHSRSWLAGITIAAWFVGLSLLAPARWLRRYPVIAGLIVSLPVWAMLLLWAVAPHEENNLPDVLSAELRETLNPAPSAIALRLLTALALLGLLGALRMLALLAAVEIADAQTSVARSTARWRWLDRRGVVAVVVAVKVAVVVLGFAGLFGGRSAGGTWDPGEWQQWALAGATVVMAASVYAYSRRQPLRTGTLRPMTAVLVVGFGLPAIVMLLVATAQGLGALYPTVWQVTLRARTLETAAAISGYVPLTVVIVAGALGIGWAVRRGLSDGAVLGIALLVWGLPASLHYAFIDPDMPASARPAVLQALPIPNQIISLIALDVAITIAVALALLFPSRKRVAPADLLVVLLIASLIAYSADALIPDEAASTLFLVGLLAPVAWRFVINTREERQRPPARTVVSMAVWSALLAASTVALAGGISSHEWASDQRIQWKLLVIPFAFVLLCRRSTSISSESEQAAPGWRGSVPPAAEGPEPRSARMIGAVIGGLVIASSVGALLTALSAPIAVRATHRVDAQLPTGWTPLQCPGASDAEVLALSAPNNSGYILAGYGTPDSLRVVMHNCAKGVPEEQERKWRGQCTDPILSPALVLVDMPVHLYIEKDVNVVTACRWVTIGNLERFIFIQDAQPRDSTLRAEMAAGTESIRFTDH